MGSLGPHLQCQKCGMGRACVAADRSREGGRNLYRARYTHSTGPTAGKSRASYTLLCRGSGARPRLRGHSGWDRRMEMGEGSVAAEPVLRRAVLVLPLQRAGPEIRVRHGVHQAAQAVPLLQVPQRGGRAAVGGGSRDQQAGLACSGCAHPPRPPRVSDQLGCRCRPPGCVAARPRRGPPSPRRG